jgi:amidophosphoribosyltransferase
LCGIGGLIYHTPEQYRHLGSDLLSLIQPLESRGPDSCGVALYSNQANSNSRTFSQVKVILQGEENVPWSQVGDWINQFAPVDNVQTTTGGQQITLRSTKHGQISSLPQLLDLRKFKQALCYTFPSIHLVSIGESLEIYKEVGSAKSLAQKYGLERFSGSHGIAHTRMATESVVDKNHCHPFTSSFDLSVVHNGQISNYYKLRFQLEQAGAVFETNNDSEVIAHAIQSQLQQGKSLEAALKKLLNDLDGTYTFLVATQDQVGLVRDKFAAKPAVIYESSECVAIASEYQALMHLPNFDATATIREPDAGEINVWSVVTTPQREVLQTCTA